MLNIRIRVKVISAPWLRIDSNNANHLTKSPWHISINPQNLPARAQWPVEATDPIHVLPVLRLLLLPHTVDVVARHFGLLRAPETGKAHHSPHLRCLGIFVHVHGVRDFGLGGRRCFGGRD